MKEKGANKMSTIIQFQNHRLESESGLQSFHKISINLGTFQSKIKNNLPFVINIIKQCTVEIPKSNFS